ncbi:MAG: FAD-dependent oxidoreductase [Chloroflexi bacterium]|nr:FAD-dependent oxidoreductase [Chloroflexota bacterium]
MAIQTDIIIVGGGSVGLHCAYYLLKAGRKVTLVEQNQIGDGSSSGNAGQIVPSHIIPLAAPGIVSTAFKWMLDSKNSPFGMKFSLDPTYILWLIKFAASCNDANVQQAIPPLNAIGQLSTTNFSQIITQEKFECAYQEKGVLFLYKDAKAFEDGIEEGKVMQKHGIPIEVLDQEAIRKFEPVILDSIVGGINMSGDSNVNPAVYLKLLGERLREMGAEIYENTSVTGFDLVAGKIQGVKTSAGVFEANEVILAAGAATPIVGRDLRLNIPVQSARGYSMTISAPKKMPRQPLLLGERRVAVSPMGDLLRFTGRLELSNVDRTVNQKHIVGIERAVREYMQLEEKLDVKETWAGLRPTTPDGVPIIGRSARYKNLIIATGHAMLGLSLGPGTGQVVSELVSGQKSAFDLSPLRIERF